MSIEVDKSFSATGASDSMLLGVGESLAYTVDGTFVGTVKVTQSIDGGATRQVLATLTAPGSGTVTFEGPGSQASVRFDCTAYTSGTADTTLIGGQNEVEVFKNRHGAVILTLKDDGVEVPGNLVLSGTQELTGELSGTGTVELANLYEEEGHSHQAIAADMELGVDAGDSTDPKFLAAIMGNVIGASLTKTKPYLAGLIGMYSVTGLKATTYESGAVLAGIADGVTAVDGAVVAFIDGDSAITTAGAAFKVRNNNSNAASGFDFGVDLQDAAHDGYQPVDNAFYLKAPIRLVQDICILAKAGVPTDGVAGTGVAVAGPGSICVDYTNSKLYVNGGTKASPTWKLVTSAA